MYEIIYEGPDESQESSEMRTVMELETVENAADWLLQLMNMFALDPIFVKVTFEKGSLLNKPSVFLSTVAEADGVRKIACYTAQYVDKTRQTN